MLVYKSTHFKKNIFIFIFESNLFEKMCQFIYQNVEKKLKGT